MEVEARSQWAYSRRRFSRHRLAMVSLAALIGSPTLAQIFAEQLAPDARDHESFIWRSANSPPTR